MGPGPKPGKRPYKRKRNGERRSASSRTAAWYLKQVKACDRAIGNRMGWGRRQTK